MNSFRAVVSLGLILIFSLLWTACGGGGSTPPPPPGAPTIRTVELPQGAVNAPYLVNGNPVVLSATGGTGTYTWSIASGSLPPGLSLNAQTGVISGTPTAFQQGGYPFTARVTDAANMSSTANLSIYIQGVVSIMPAALASGSVGVPYPSQTLTATGGLPPYTWCVLAGSSGPCDPTQAGLPVGLTLNTSTGVISGVPTTNGSPTKFYIQVTDSETSPGIPASGSSMFTITIMSITTTSLPPGYANTPYNGTLTVAGGSTPYSWTYSSLPPGLSLASTCTRTKQQTCAITGTPTQTGPFTATVMVADGEKPSPAVATAVAMASFPVTVYQGSQLTITTTALPPGTEGTPYNATLTASGGIQPYTWTISSGTLPTGLSLDPTTCTNSSVPCKVSGTPTTVGPFNFTVQVTDSGSPQQPASAPFSILISFSPVVITTTSLPSGLVGVPYTGNLTATGGVKPYTWGIASGSLPPGLSLDPTTCIKSSVPCVITGTPTQGGSFGFVVQVQDSGSPQQTVPANLGILINSLGNSTLSGNYVLNFSGYNNGALVVMAGSFVADGKGTLTSGVLDYNDGKGEPVDSNGRPIPQTFVSGSVYSIHPDGSGTMTIVTNLPTTFNFAIAVRSDGSGSLIQSDPANPQAYGSGAIMGNTPLGQGEQWPLCGSPIAVGLYGLNTTQTARYAAAGQFQYDPHTCVDAENGTLDIDNGGTPSSATFTGAFNGYDNASSRGILGITYNSDQSARYFDPFYLILSSDRKQKQLFLLTENVCDTMLKCTPTGPTLWSALPQANPPAGWNNANLAGAAVAELNALDTTSAADVTAGLFVGSGSSNNNCQNGNYDKATFSFDENQGGVLLSQQQQTDIKYCVDQTTARVTVCYFDQNGACVGTPPVFYLVKSNQGFVVGTDPAVTSGYLEQQTGSSFSNASLFGLYAGGTIAPITSMVTNSVSALFADGGGNINGTESTSGPGGPGGPTQVTYTYGVDNTGRTLVCASGTCNAQSTNIIGVAYVVSSTKFVLLPATDPNPALSVFGQ